MKLIHCTNKLINDLNTYVQPKYEDHINVGLGDWYANIFELNRKRCLIFVNSNTLCAFVVPNLLKKDLVGFHDFFLNGVRKLLEQCGATTNTIDQIISEYLHIQIVKTESKSIMGSMNDYVQFYKSIFEKTRTDNYTIERFNINVNKRPMGALNFNIPIERLKNLLFQEYSKSQFKIHKN